VNVLSASTSNKEPGSQYENWTESCTIDTIIYERLSDAVKPLNKTETTKTQTVFTPTDQFEKQNGLCRQSDTSIHSQDDIYNPIGVGTLKDVAVCIQYC
jgi:hypothetical protein